MWLEYYIMDEFLVRYVPRMERFLRVLERAEAKSASTGGGEMANELRLSTRMRMSWETGRFWFNYAARMCLDIDDLYWQALHDRSDGDCTGLDDDATRAEVESLGRIKMMQRNSHKWTPRRTENRAERDTMPEQTQMLDALYVPSSKLERL